MTLEMKGALIGDVPGFHLNAVDEDRPVTFILPSEVAMRAFRLDRHSGELLASILNNRVPEIWGACLAAYAQARNAGVDVTVPLTLIEANFARPRH